MTSTLNELRQEHQSITDVLSCLDHQMRMFENGTQPDFDVVLAAIDYFEGFPQACHHPKEDVIFRQLGKRDRHAAKQVGDLVQAHAKLAADFAKFAEAIREVLGEAELPRDAIIAWARDFIAQQQRHMAMEEASFFPAVEAALTDADWREIAAKAPRGKDPLREREARFEALHRHIVAWNAQDVAGERGAPGVTPRSTSPAGAAAR
jgi:hemerythrin-like domain-containing protein